ncbi:(2Fe-2S)-binding protein [Massilia sp. TS11]|uniref:(2Fe-2S)-binding protein n=1 Tax=Massilia sp. TS11 TaxID=2908003 RepID=UPI001EDBC323|nr:(2Fe-2S)-binding protein [Massilia sp. TS11]MCG2583080.1 (2Fe-2S)-binding protein [Massilia sp. TS11]
MDETLTIVVDGRPLPARRGISVAAALMAADHLRTRTSVRGQPRFAVCGMGVCQECRVSIDGVAQRLACQTLVAPGMRIDTGGPLAGEGGA